jgi:hypothetical protein
VPHQRVDVVALAALLVVRAKLAVEARLAQHLVKRMGRLVPQVEVLVPLADRLASFPVVQAARVSVKHSRATITAHYSAR